MLFVLEDVALLHKGYESNGTVLSKYPENLRGRKRKHPLKGINPGEVEILH
jgi:hypothetical protein